MTPRDRLAIRLGATVIGIAIVVWVAIPRTWRWWSGERERLYEAHALVARARTEVEAMPGLDSTAGEVRARFLALAPRLVAGGTSAEAEAALSGLVTGFADRAHVRMRRAEPAPDSLAAGRLRRVSLKVEIEGDWAGALGFLGALAHERTSLSIGEVSVQANDPTSGADRPEVLVMQAEIGGWYLPAGSR